MFLAEKRRRARAEEEPRQEQELIHKEFTAMIDSLMQSLLLDVGISQQQFLEACKEAKQNKNQWKITTNALFVRLDAFSERCQDLMHLTSTIIQFSKLERIEIIFGIHRRFDLLNLLACINTVDVIN